MTHQRVHTDIDFEDTDEPTQAHAVAQSITQQLRDHVSKKTLRQPL